MPVTEPFPSLQEFLENIGRAGTILAAISASEGAAGNISVCIGWPIEVRRRFPIAETLALPTPVPALGGHTVIVTGSGRRLREVAIDPEANLGALTIDDGGATATMHTSTRRLFARLTSELNSHLAVHADQVTTTGTNFNALIHAQPLRTTLLSHIAEYRDGDTMTRRLFRFEPETIVNLPEGICVLPFLLPGSPQLEAANLAGLRTHRIVVWSKHGVMARSDRSATAAADLVEYVETAATYETLDRSTGQHAEGLTDAELHAIVEAFSVPTTLY
jgi:rhamnulose-1-phosphate aldolase